MVAGPDESPPSNEANIFESNFILSNKQSDKTVIDTRNLQMPAFWGKDLIDLSGSLGAMD